MKKIVRHRTSDKDGIHLWQECVNERNLRLRLCPAEHHEKRMLRCECTGEFLHFVKKRNPAYDGRSAGRRTIDACARCDAEKASFTYTSPSAARRAAKTSSFSSSPLEKRRFSQTNTEWPSARPFQNATSSV